MSPEALTPLERAILDRMHDLYGGAGFPSADQLYVARRTNTGHGRYVDLAGAVGVNLRDGFLDLGGAYIEMEGVPEGMAAVASVESGRLQQLDIHPYGELDWDGEESGWALSLP